MEKWNDKKNNQSIIENIYLELSQTEKDQAYYLKKANRLHDCGTWLKFLACPKGHERHLVGANFCKLRLCSMCQWRRSLFTYHQFLTVAHKVQELCPGSKYIFLTLTGKNVTAQELPGAITHYLNSFRRLTRYKAFKQAIKGTFRTLEISYNAESNTYHPHFHIIGVVNKSYFLKSKIYISQNKLTDLWQKAFQVDYTPICDVRKVRKRDQKKSTVLDEMKKQNDVLAGAAAEVAKYSVKFADILNSNNKNEVIKVLDDALNHRRLIGYTGIMKKAYEALKLNDVEDSDLVDVGETNFDENCQCSICQSEMIHENCLFNFQEKKYKKYEKKEKKSCHKK